MSVEDIVALIHSIDAKHERAEAERKRKRDNPTPAERAERTEDLRARYSTHVVNDLHVFAFKRRIRARLTWHAAGLMHSEWHRAWPKDGPIPWAALHSSMTFHGAPNTGHWFRANEGTYPCVHEGVLIGFCSPEYARAFEQLVASGRLSVKIDLTRLGCHYDNDGLPETMVWAGQRSDEPTEPDSRPAA